MVIIFETDGKKLLEIMWRNDPDVINSIIRQLKTAKREQPNWLNSTLRESIARFVWQDISELLHTIGSSNDDTARREALQEFIPIFLDECERIINK